MNHKIAETSTFEPAAEGPSDLEPKGLIFNSFKEVLKLNPFGTRLAPTFSRQYSRTVASSHVFLLIKPGLVAIAY